MAARPTWKGYLKVSLVNIPVRVFSATDSASTVSFNQLHADCQSRIQQKKWYPSCETEVVKSDLVKGYEFEKGRHVVLLDDDISMVRPESTRVINLVRFTDAARIDPAHLERPYYPAPDGKVGRRVCRHARGDDRQGRHRQTGAARPGVSRRGPATGPRPRQLHAPSCAQLRRMNAIDELDQLPETVSPDEAQLAWQVISTFEGALDLTEFRDQYQEELRAVIDAKIAEHEVVAPSAETPPKVVNLMDALRKSLDSVSEARKKSANVERMPARSTARHKLARG